MQQLQIATAQISTNTTPKQSFTQQKNSSSKSSSFDEMVNFYKTQANSKSEVSDTKKMQPAETSTLVENKLPQEKIDVSDENVEVVKKSDVAELSENEIEQLTKIDEQLKEKISDVEKDVVVEFFDVNAVSRKIENADEEIVVMPEDSVTLAALANFTGEGKIADVKNPTTENTENVAEISEQAVATEMAQASMPTATENVSQQMESSPKKADVKIASEKEVPEEIVADAKRDATFVKAEIVMNTNADAEAGDKNQSEKNPDGSRTWKFDNEGKITVTDYRTQPAAQAQNVQNIAASSNNDVDVAKNASSEEINTIQMNMNLAQKAEQNILSNNTQTASAHGSDFQAMLANQIQENAGEFVKAGSIVLRDGDMGEINLTLNPEKLGNVKISLQLSDKVIAGQITVASREAYNAFKESAETLRQAFIQNGFEMDGLNVSWAGQNAANSFAENQNDGGKQFAASRAYGEYAADGAESEGFANEYGQYENNTVNVTA